MVEQVQKLLVLRRYVYKALCACYSDVCALVEDFIDCEINSEICRKERIHEKIYSNYVGYCDGFDNGG